MGQQIKRIEQMGPHFRGEIKQIKQDALINRSQMLAIARDYNLVVTKSTIHRWANEPGFPYPVGQNGRYLLYSRGEVITFLKRRLRRIQEEH